MSKRIANTLTATYCASLFALLVGYDLFSAHVGGASRPGAPVRLIGTIYAMSLLGAAVIMSRKTIDLSDKRIKWCLFAMSALAVINIMIFGD